MPSLKQTKRRITSVKNTQKITKAMKLVSVAKFARAHMAVSGARPYSLSFNRLVRRLLNSANCEIASPFFKHPGESVEKKVLLAILSTDRGLCGSLNTNLFKKTSHFLNEKQGEGVDVKVLAWGRKAQGYAKRLGLDVVDKKERVLEKPTYEKARVLTAPLIDQYLKGDYDAIYLAVMEFKSAISQAPTVIKLLPVETELDGTASEAAKEDELRIDYIIEPNFEDLIHRMLERKLIGTVLRCLLEAAASEHGARMTAMDSATKNASEVIRKLTLKYNRARQSAITKELIEITSGAEAL